MNALRLTQMLAELDRLEMDIITMTEWADKNADEITPCQYSCLHFARSCLSNAGASLLSVIAERKGGF